jgi:hypothetical protein
MRRLETLLQIRSAFLIVIIFCAAAPQAWAAHWLSAQTGPTTWTYTLQIDPEDNFNISQSTTTITMTGLIGVTSASGPTSSDFNPQPGGILNWTPQVLNGGTKVVWSISGGGTGNFPGVQHVFGFSITAPNAVNGTVSFATSGFQVDSGGPNRDTSGTVAGPAAVGTANAPVPAASSVTLVLMFAGLGIAGAYAAKRRLHDKFRG